MSHTWRRPGVPVFTWTPAAERPTARLRSHWSCRSDPTGRDAELGWRLSPTAPAAVTHDARGHSSPQQTRGRRAWKVRRYLRFVANEDVVVHRFWDVVHGELQVGSLGHVGEALAGPGGPAIQRTRPGNHLDPLREVETGTGVNRPLQEAARQRGEALTGPCLASSAS